MCDNFRSLVVRVDEILGGISNDLIDLKMRNIGVVQGRISSSEAMFLDRALEFLLDNLQLQDGERVINNTMNYFADKLITEDDCMGAYSFIKETGLDKNISGEHAASLRYLFAQWAFLDSSYWASPVDALMFGACQLGTHSALEEGCGSVEGRYTEKFLKIMPQTIQEKVVIGLKDINLDDHQDLFMQFAVASMEEQKDLQGADLAIVMGTIINNEPQWRVVLMQAKREISQGRSYVGHNNGLQLCELVMTEMGAYLFYPKLLRKKSFIPTVRLAEDVMKDVDSNKLNKIEMPYKIDSCAGHGSTWDFASFVAIEMRKNTGGPGKICVSLDEVAEVLSIGRDVPHTARLRPPYKVFIASTHPRLSVVDFIPKLKETYKKNVKSFGFIKDIMPGHAPGFK